MNRKQKTTRLAVCSMLSAVGVILLWLGSVTDVADLSMAMLASLIGIFALIEFGGSAPWLIFATISVLSLLLLPNRSPAFMYLLFFGYYPILKTALEKKNPLLSWVLKEVVFHAALAFILLTLRFVLLAPDLMSISPLWAAVLLVMAEITFLLYDLVLSRVTVFYLRKLRHRFRWKH